MLQRLALDLRHLVQAHRARDDLLQMRRLDRLDQIAQRAVLHRARPRSATPGPPVMITNGTSRSCSRTARSRSRPFIPGIAMSLTMTSKAALARPRGRLRSRRCADLDREAGRAQMSARSRGRWPARRRPAGSAHGSARVDRGAGPASSGDCERLRTRQACHGLPHIGRFDSSRRLGRAKLIDGGPPNSWYMFALRPQGRPHIQEQERR